ncbi:hypothetical protein [Synechococcus sp. RedBA-s]|uniref:hypothetical protein n=1 Tax=Synechococcus sp. RedBA-s TaxID=2823741 RepID=UPI0020CBC4C8|nr:hypothetical protein [Synechococcus sp. RedBA-s]MCP9799946.1 hypothetical protein [Synechococcus sp. RedBA-s]
MGEAGGDGVSEPHGGLNTVLKSLSDEVSLKQVSALRLRAAIDQLWNDYSYRENAQRLQQACAVAGSA